MPQHEPATPAEMAERLEIVKGLIVKGLTTAEIVRYITEKHDAFGLQPRMLRNYVYQAKDELTSDARTVDRSAEFAIAKQRNDLVFYNAIKIQDNKTALDANWKNVRLMRLDTPQAQGMDWSEVARQLGYENREQAYSEFMDMMHTLKDNQVTADDSEPDTAE